MQCHSSGLVNSAQHFPTSYEGTHACTHAILGLSSNTWHKRMPHDSPFLSVGHSVARKSRQEMIILSLPRRESFWFSLCQRENLLEAKPVDVRLRRNDSEGREGKSFSDLVRRKQRLVTAKQFSLPRLRSDSVVRRPWRALRLHVTSKPHKKQSLEQENAATNLTKVVWVDARLVASAAMMTRSAPASQLIWRSTCTTRHEHSFWARASRIRYGHIQTKLTFICGFSLNPPPPHTHYIVCTTHQADMHLACALRHCIQISMEAILACHPALSAKWLDWAAKWCELWHMHTGPSVQVHWPFQAPRWRHGAFPRRPWWSDAGHLRGGSDKTKWTHKIGDPASTPLTPSGARKRQLPRQT